MRYHLEPTLDATDFESLEISAWRLAARLLEEERHKFINSFNWLSRNISASTRTDILLNRLHEFAQKLRTDPDAMYGMRLEAFREHLHGKTSQEVIALVQERKRAGCCG
jgi:hypothetical protein